LKAATATKRRSGTTDGGLEGTEVEFCAHEIVSWEFEEEAWR
jgi:hypothetical protein